MLNDWFSGSFPEPMCHRAYGFVCNSACVFTVCMVRQALKRAMHDQILSHLHPDLLVSHLRLRSWETWAVCLPLPWCAKRGPEAKNCAAQAAVQRSLDGRNGF